MVLRSPSFHKGVDNPGIELRRLLAGKRNIDCKVIREKVNEVAISVFVQQRNVLKLGRLEVGSRDMGDSQFEVKS